MLLLAEVEGVWADKDNGMANIGPKFDRIRSRDKMLRLDKTVTESCGGSGGTDHVYHALKMDWHSTWMVWRKQGQQWIPKLLLLVLSLVHSWIVVEMIACNPSIDSLSQRSLSLADKHSHNSTHLMVWILKEGEACEVMTFKMVVKSTVCLSFWRHKSQDMNRLSGLVWTCHFATDSASLDSLVSPHLSWQGNTMPLSPAFCTAQPTAFHFCSSQQSSLPFPFLLPSSEDTW